MSSKPTEPATKPCNIPGIEYDHAFAESLQTNLSALAGIFNFPTTQELWDLTQKDPSTKPIFDAWAGERKNFPTNLRGLTHTKLMNLASNQAFHPILANDKHPAFSSQVFQQNQSQLPAQGKVEVNNMNLPHLTALWYITKLIREKPALFPGSSVSSVSQTTGEVIMSFDAYDLFHAWKLLKWIWWVKVPKTKPRVKRATPPVFHTDSTGSTAGDASGGLDGASSSVVKVEDSKDTPSVSAITLSYWAFMLIQYRTPSRFQQTMPPSRPRTRPKMQPDRMLSKARMTKSRLGRRTVKSTIQAKMQQGRMLPRA